MITPEVLAQAAFSSALFLFFWLVFGRRILRPYLALLEERESRTVGDAALAQQRRKESQTLKDETEQRLRQARLDGLARGDRRIQRAKQEAQTIQEHAFRAARERIERAHREIARLRADAERFVPEEAEKLAEVVAERAVSPNVTLH